MIAFCPSCAFPSNITSSHYLFPFRRICLGPKTALKFFDRTTRGHDISTGNISLDRDPYCTNGPLSTWHIKNKVPPPVETRCYILDPLRVCNEVHIKALRDGLAAFEDFVVIDILPERVEYYKQGEADRSELEWIQKVSSSLWNILV